MSTHVLSPIPEYTPPPPAPPAEHCTAHLARTGELRPVFRMELCHDCFDDKPIMPAELKGVGTGMPLLAYEREMKLRRRQEVPKPVDPKAEALQHTMLKVATAQNIAAACADYYDIARQMMFAPTKDRKYMRARHLARYLARELVQLSYPQIGSSFGGRHYTVVMASVRYVEEHMDSFATPIRELKKKFQKPAI